MSNEEYAATIQAGDASALVLLWEQVRRLCLFMVRRYLSTAAANKAIDMDDLMQAAFLGVHRAVQAYKPSEGAFSTILGFYVKSECQALLGLHGRIREEHYQALSMDAPISMEDGTGCALGDLVEDTTLPGLTDAMELQDLKREVWEAVTQLPEQQAILIREYYLQNRPMHLVANQLGIPLNMARRLRGKACMALYRNRRLRTYEADFYRHKGFKSFNSSWSSVVEDIALRRLGYGMRSEPHGID